MVGRIDRETAKAAGIAKRDLNHLLIIVRLTDLTLSCKPPPRANGSAARRLARFSWNSAMRSATAVTPRASKTREGLQPRANIGRLASFSVKLGRSVFCTNCWSGLREQRNVRCGDSQPMLWVTWGERLPPLPFFPVDTSRALYGRCHQSGVKTTFTLPELSAELIWSTMNTYTGWPDLTVITVPSEVLTV
jgi:hypothetical protein